MPITYCSIEIWRLEAGLAVLWIAKRARTASVSRLKSGPWNSLPTKLPPGASTAVAISSARSNSASEFGMFSQTAFRLAQRIFPGPYTLVVPATRSVPRTLTDSKRRTVGIRVTSHPIAQALAQGLGRPLLTTSAIAPATGEPCRDADEILEAFAKHIDLVIDTEQTPAAPSTVIEVDGDNITLIREGQGPLTGVLDL